jgi:hypothetical protein
MRVRRTSVGNSEPARSADRRRPAARVPLPGSGAAISAAPSESASSAFWEFIVYGKSAGSARGCIGRKSHCEG